MQQFTATGTFTDSHTQDLTSTASWAADTPVMPAGSHEGDKRNSHEYSHIWLLFTVKACLKTDSAMFDPVTSKTVGP
jgi:hypothetical protein